MNPRPHARTSLAHAPRLAARRPVMIPLAVVAAAMGGGGLALMSAGPAAADANAAGQLGGFQVSASGAGIRFTYEQPNFPVPATPTLEGNIGYATTNYNYGPSGSSTASTLWPGQVAAGFGSQLPLLLQPYLGSHTPNLNLGPWPLQATTAFPQSPSAPTTANQDSAGVTMEASSTADAGTATADFGTSTGPDAPAALPSGVVQVQSIGSTVLGQVQSTSASGVQAVSQATASLQGIQVAGIIDVGTLTTTATCTSDGNTANVTGSSTVSQMTIAGQAVTIDKDGLHAANQNAGLLGSLLPSVDKVLDTAGITIALEQPTDTVSAAAGERVLPGLEITIDLTKYDQQFNQLVGMIPSALKAALVKLPIPFPNEQVMTINLGWVDVKASASPSFDAAGQSTDTSGSGDLGSGTTAGSFGDTGGGGGSSFTPGTAGTSGTPGTGGGSSPAGPALATAPVGLFKGLGAGLIALGLLLAAGLAFLLLRADAAVGSMAAAPACAGEEQPDL